MKYTLLIHLLILGAISTSRAQLTASITTNNQVSCNTACDGSLEVTPLNGTPPYAFLWSDFDHQTSALVTGLCPIVYKVTVTDVNNDQIIIEDTIKTATESVIHPINITDVTDTISCNGAISIGHLGFQYINTYWWSTGQTSTNSSITGLCQGVYSVTVLDEGVCLYSWKGEVSNNSITSVNKSESREDILVWPIPANKFIEIRSNNPIVQVDVYDIRGSKIKTYKNQYILDVETIENGTYILKITDLLEKQTIKKILINN
jgi:hypothetical protein